VLLLNLALNMLGSRQEKDKYKLICKDDTGDYVMNRQWDALIRIQPGLCHKYPGCGILVFGSVGRGEERPDSDLDVMVIFNGPGELKWDPSAPIGDPDLNIDLAVFPEVTLQQVAKTRWFVFWELSQAKIVHDPTGIAERNQAILRKRFSDHPEIAQVWKEYLTAHGRSKKGESVKQRFSGRAELETHLEKMLSSDT
jgi:hypothetical protein